MISKNQIKEVKALHLKKFRDDKRLFIAEGMKIVSEIILYRPEQIQELYVTQEFIEHRNSKLSSKLNVNVIADSDLERISMLNTPNQALAICNYFDDDKPKLNLATNFSLYLDDIRDPGNLGTILRTAEWFGMTEIFASKTSTDIYNPKTIQAAMGAFLRVKVHYVDLSELISEKNFPVYGAVLNGNNMYNEKLKNGLIVIGNEANGISSSHLKFITHPITIPSAVSNNTESLNAAMATSIICAEFYRQSVQ